MKAAGVVSSSHLQDFDEPWGAAVARGVLPAGSVVVNSRCAVALAPIAAADVWRCGDQVAAVLLSREMDVEELGSGQLELETLAKQGGRAVTVQGRWIEHVWDFLAHLQAMLTEDITALIAGAPHDGKWIPVATSPHSVFTEMGATVEPHVHFDTSAGPVLIRRGATVHAFTRIIGPCVIGAESFASGDKIEGSSIGDKCKVHGEMNGVIFVGHSNKGHDGFVGQSYLGRWVNLGAGTITSNLKNTYGPVRLWTPAGEQDTGLQFVGTFFGDHAKTGIGTMLSTGSVVGAGANIYGSGATPKVIPPFAWGDHPPYSTYRLDKFLEVVRRVMARRHVELSARQARALTASYERRWSVDKQR
jgi:UDP-N-acetylglucosamine diphosphorylase/glucosamine-1-phosphate N-acetyltransferase